MPPRPEDFDDNLSPWVEGHGDYAAEAPLSGARRVDVAIIGGGFAGTSAAWHLSERFPDKAIALIEAKTLANGASGRNGGQMLHWINGVGYDDPALTKRVYEATDAGIQWVLDTIRDHQLPVRHALRGTFELITDARRVADAKAHVDKLNGWGIPLRFLEGADLHPKLRMQGVVAGVEDPHTGMLNGADFVRALKPILLQRGVQIYENTLVRQVQTGKTHTLTTSDGTLSADALVLATNGYTGKLGFFKNQIFPLHSHMVATAPMDAATQARVGWGQTDAFCDDLDRIAFGALDTDGRLLFGGGSNASYGYGFGGPTALDPTHHAPSHAAVTRRLHGYFPELAAAPLTHRWGGTLGITFNRQCSIGRMGPHQNIYYALGFSGHGVTLANLSGQVICDLYSDHPEPWRDLPFTNNPLLWIPPEPFRWMGYHLVTGLTGKSPRRRG